MLAGDGCPCTGRPFHGATLPIGYDAEPTRHRIGEATAGRMKPAGDGDVCADGGFSTVEDTEGCDCMQGITLSMCKNRTRRDCQQ